MRARNLILAFFLFLPILAFSTIAGRYNSEITRGDGSKINATAEIIHSGSSVYQIVWTYDDHSTEVGTGVKKGDTISFVFQSGEPSNYLYGVTQYQIEGKTLKGPWVYFGLRNKGFEKLKKIQ